MNRARRTMPAWLWLPAALGAALFALPLLGLFARAPWADVPTLLTDAATRTALWLSLRCSLLAALLSAALGLPLAAWLAAGDGPLRTAVRALVTLPMVLPPVVGGLALLLAFGRQSPLGGALDAWFGVEVPFTQASVVLAMTYIAMPFFVLTVEGGLRGLDPRYGEAAGTLGAGPWRTFHAVTLPMVLPGLRAGLLVTWARALGEFGATITFAGSFEGRTRTLPLAVYHALESRPPAAIALSLLLLAIATVVLFLSRRHWLWRR